MTVQQLKDRLVGFPDQSLVIMASDSEGNSYSPCEDLGSKFYLPSSAEWIGAVFDEKQSAPDGSVPVSAVVLWPAHD
jgi:hypothetical protein